MPVNFARDGALWVKTASDAPWRRRHSDCLGQLPLARGSIARRPTRVPELDRQPRSDEWGRSGARGRPESDGLLESARRVLRSAPGLCVAIFPPRIRIFNSTDGRPAAYVRRTCPTKGW